ncbi:NAD(P)/FAD-dependent oxidoreductase [Streptomyces sp. NBC_01171]|uniref:NAD(P)/FAD-dependent oxidoreductase n=1 Tax=Streptomyces sp. NBC_01171 TaxID=2903757 RepID=UPI00386ACC31|nr:FAD-binding oxidoreductase [Streptomyces sp. NBC_01171]
MSNSEITYTSSTPWIDPPDDMAQALRGDIGCDVVVVGGGLMGLSTALRLAERGVDTVLLEAGFCGSGASSRNAGQLSGAPAGDVELLSYLHPRRFPGIVRFADHSAHFAEDLVKRLDVDCDYEPTGNVMAAVTKGQFRSARKKAQILKKAGGEAHFGDHLDLGVPDTFFGGLLEPAGGLMNPGKFTLGLRDAVSRAGVRVFERTSVTSVVPDGAKVLVSAEHGRVRAERVVLATNAYSRDLAIAPKRLAAPIWVTEVETEPIEPGRLEAAGWTSRAGIATQHNLMQNYRPTARGTLVFGVRRIQVGGKSVNDRRRPDPSVVADLVRGFRAQFPSLRDVAPKTAWGGWIALTPSWLPVAGEATKNVFYATACNGHGLAQAPYLGTLLADRIVGDPLHEDLGAVWRQHPRFMTSPVTNSPVLRTAWAVDRLSERLGSTRLGRG